MPILFAILVLTAPLYVWRFSIGDVPTNFLMLFAFVVIGIAELVLWNRHKFSPTSILKSYWRNIINTPKLLLTGITLICLASVVSLFAFGFEASKFAQWIVLYFQPISFYFIIRYFSERDTDSTYNIRRYVSLAVYWLLFTAGLLAIVQYTTLASLPSDWWGNANEPKRAIAFFAHPNAYALFATPLLAWLLPDVIHRAQAFWATIKRNFRARGSFLWLHFACTVAWLVGAFGLFLTLSRGAWLGLLVAAGLFVLLSANKKMLLAFTALVIVVGIIVAVVPNLRYRVILPFYGEKSAVARLSLWQTGQTMLTDNSPTSLILGKGINGFKNNWDKFNIDPNLKHYNFPHNIFLNFWIDLGLLGLVGFILVFVSAVWRGIKERKNPLALGLLLFVAAIIAHGLIDIPYLKNDLALMFWVILALSTSSIQTRQTRLDQS